MDKDKFEFIKEFDSLQELNIFERKNKIYITNIDHVNKIWIVTYKQNMENDKDKFEIDWMNWIGKDVKKRSNKPFLGGEKIARVLGIETNHHSTKFGFKLDDGSTVDCYQCKLVVSL